MNRHDALERELTAWFVDAAMPRTPDYTTDIVKLTATMRQRPRWTFPERWVPMSVITLARRSIGPVPWRTVAVFVILGLLLATVAVIVGSQQRLPAPFGVAANGLVAYAKDGHIFTVDPATGSRRSISSAVAVDERPLWSLDGTRLAFLRVVRPWDMQRNVAGVHVLVVVDKEANVIATSEPIEGIDPDSLAWSPDSRSLIVAAGPDPQSPFLHKIDAVDGAVTQLKTGYTGLDFYLRPAHENQILFRGRMPEGGGLVVASLAEPSGAELVVKDTAGHLLRPNGWTKDGRSIVYTRGEVAFADEYKPGTIRLHVLDIETKLDIEIEAGFGHVSNDGLRIVALDAAGRPCVASIDGGPCLPIGEVNQAYAGYHAAGAYWAPSDEWIVVRSVGDRSLLLDPTGGTGEQPTWVADGAESWQRLAP
jgi:hypothetical protein